MNDNAVLLQPAYILRHSDYRESSVLMDVLTRDHGVVSILGKGVRKKKSASAALLMPFNELRLSYLGKNELKLLTAVERAGQHDMQRGYAWFCGFYINELVWLFLHKYDPCPDVYRLYQHCLRQLSHSAEIEQALRIFELKLLAQVGYALTLTHEGNGGMPVSPEKRYQYQSGIGLVSRQDGVIGGQTLLRLAEEGELDRFMLTEAKQLMRMVLDDHLQGKVLKSRAVLARVIRYLQ